MQIPLKKQAGIFSLLMVFTYMGLSCPVQGQNVRRGLNSLDFELVKIFGETIQFNYQHELSSMNTFSIGPRYSGFGKHSDSGQGWGLEFQYLREGNGNQFNEIQDYSQYIRDPYNWYLAFFVTGDHLKKNNDYRSEPDMSTTSFSLGALLDFRLYPADKFFVDFYAGLGYRFSNNSSDIDYFEYANHFFRPGYSGLILKTGVKTGFHF